MANTTSYLDQYRKASSGIGRANAAIGGVMTGIGGAEQILSNAFTASRVNDVPQYDWSINQLGQIGNGSYNSFEELSRDYANSLFFPDIQYDDIRGMNGWQKAGNIGTSALSGATTGLTVGGPWGALIGGLIGAGAGAIGVIAGDINAGRKEEDYRSRALLAQGDAQSNLNAAHERLTDYRFRSGVAHAVANGGNIQRGRQTLQQFAKKVLKEYNTRDSSVPDSIIHRKCKGGTMVRIKR